MKRTLLLFVISILAGRVSAAPFQNLDFEQARTNSVTPSLNPSYRGQGTGPVSELLPGWQLRRNSQPITTMDYNNLGTFEIRDYPSLIGPPGLAAVIEGRFSFLLSFFGASANEYRLAQRAEIPQDAQLLFFQYQYGPFVASINGEDISPLGLPHTSTVMPRTILADISRFAGQTVELSFRASGPLGAHNLDNIGFAVPEPSTLVLVGTGILALGLTQLRRHE